MLYSVNTLSDPRDNWRFQEANKLTKKCNIRNREHNPKGRKPKSERSVQNCTGKWH